MEKSKCNKYNNSGFSFIELVVVVVIIGVMVGLTVVGMSRLFSANSSTCASLISSNLESARLETMSKQDGTIVFRLFYDATKSYTYIELEGTNQDAEKLISGKAITVIYENGTIEEVADMAGVEICFSKTTGVYLPNAEGRRVKTIVVGDTYNVQLVLDTGRNYVEQK